VTKDDWMLDTLEVMMHNKEEELNAIILELRKNYNLLQEKCTKEESNKLVSLESFVCLIILVSL